MKEFFGELLKKRIIIFSAVLLLMFLVLVRRFFVLQILNGDNYQQEFEERIAREQIYQGSRGIIYDRNGKALAYNELTYTVTMEDNGAYENRRERNLALNAQIAQVIALLEENEEVLKSYLSIEASEDGSYEFNIEENRLPRFRADIYGYARIEDLKFNERLGYDEQTATADQIMEYLCSDTMYGISEAETPEHRLQIASIRYAMGSNNYQRYIKTDLADEISEETAAAILEHQPELPGVDISERMVRRYEDSEYFAPILGYTGPVSETELEQFAEAGISYERNDVVGKAGIEQAMEEELHGRNGIERFYVDSVGRVTQTLESVEPSTGNNIYLSIDAELQKTVYNLLEQKLAGILLANITADPNENGNLIIPIQDVYCALIDNHAINVERFSEPDAGAAEREVWVQFENRLEENIARLQAAVEQPAGSLDEEMRDCVEYILEFLEREGYYRSEAVDRENEVYIQWAAGEIGLEAYLREGIEEGWVTMDSSLTQEVRYSSMDENLTLLENWIIDSLRTDSGFHRRLYRMMLRQGAISGEQISRILLEQGVVEDSGTDYESLGNGSLSAYSYIRDKIRNLEITPAQLALAPCTASSVIVEPGTGKILACVTYPGYDNNRLANSVDAVYYDQLINDASLPLYNNATQQRTAPGSTFKPVSVAAGLTEQIITRDRLIDDLGSFELITPSPRCWIFLAGGGTHGAINVIEALRDSCNYFFYTIGYEMSLEDDVYQENKGIETLTKYMEMFGFNENTGIEISESTPQMADSFPVTASIGQSNHNYTTTQLARYTASLANQGNLHQLSLINQIQEGAEGEIRTTETGQTRQLDEITPEAWGIIGEGMHMMAANNRTLSTLPFSLAGKTGTAQQNRTRPNHALFIGYAPFEQPEIAVATRIAYGYSSSTAVEVTADILRYYFGAADQAQLVDGQADMPQNSGNSFAD